MRQPTLAIDFGTSNSAAAMWSEDGIRRIPIEASDDTLPTAVFFPAYGGAPQLGNAAAAALIDGEEGRYMRALKSTLGTSLAHESRVLGGKRQTISDVITYFLRTVKSRAESATGIRFERALSGRPVHFHTKDAVRDAKAEADLTACYHAAGFSDVAFLPEPEAAARACHSMGAANGLGLIVDIGGGTSDFTVFKTDGDRPRILLNHGIRLGGTDFDRHISLDHVMPALGLGARLRREMGEGWMPVPKGLYSDLATWAKIPFLYTPETKRLVTDMKKLAEDPRLFARFAETLDMELGHDIAFAVERGKIAANATGDGAFDLTFLEKGLSRPVTGESLNAALVAPRVELSSAITETLSLAQVTADQITRIILVGGSSLMEFVSQSAAALCPNATILRSEAFTAVVDGLAIASAD